MKLYMAQKAQQALNELCTESPLAERLRHARSHLHLVSGDHYLNNCPGDLRESMKAFLDSDVDKDTKSSAIHLQAVVEHIFEQAGRQDFMDEREHN